MTDSVKCHFFAERCLENYPGIQGDQSAIENTIRNKPHFTDLSGVTNDCYLVINSSDKLDKSYVSK